MKICLDGLTLKKLFQKTGIGVEELDKQARIYLRQN
jgi:hypothetical protein